MKLKDYFKVKSSKRVLKKEWKKKGIPFYRGREITKLSKFGSVDNELFITKEHYKKLSLKHGTPKEGDIMITAIGTIGNAYIVKKSDIFYFKDASVLWLEKFKNIDSKFVSYWLKSNLFYDQLDTGFGATVDTLTINKLENLDIIVPDKISGQKKIVEKLDKIFSEVEKINQITQKKLENIKILQSKILTGALKI